MKQIDVRKVPPRERHPLLFQTFDELPAGQSFELINDHDPKPLYYQIEAESKEAFTWEYLESGPDTWMVKVAKTG